MAKIKAAAETALHFDMAVRGISASPAAMCFFAGLFYHSQFLFHSLSEILLFFLALLLIGLHASFLRSLCLSCLVP